mgnify:CR=1 FL=1
MDRTETDRFRAEFPELFHIFKFHDAWTNHRDRSLLGERFNCLPVMFLCRLAGDATASTTDLPLELPQRCLLALNKYCLPRHAVERNCFRNSNKSARDSEVVLVS